LELILDKPASEVVRTHGGYHNVRRRVHYDGREEREELLAAAETFAAGAAGEVSTVDGYRVDYDDAWVLVRASGTEPLVRIYAEAETVDRAEALADEAQQGLEAAAE
jgi:phosphomannomutase/phosphoglucomutase